MLDGMSGRKKGSRGEAKRARRPGEPDEFVEMPFGFIARFGRHVHMRNTLTKEDHDEFVDAFLDGADELRSAQ